MNVIILAGGTGQRMGGIDKAQVRVDGVSLVQMLLKNVTTTLDPQNLVVVTQNPVDNVPTTYEDPPLGGPVAGINAGLKSLTEDEEFTAILAVDAPHSAFLLPTLESAISGTNSDVAVIVSANGQVQPLCAVWRTSALQQALVSLGDARGKSLKKLLRQTDKLIEVTGTGAERDYDYLEELHQLGKVELP